MTLFSSGKYTYITCTAQCVFLVVGAHCILLHIKLQNLISVCLCCITTAFCIIIGCKIQKCMDAMKRAERLSRKKLLDASQNNLKQRVQAKETTKRLRKIVDDYNPDD